LPPCVLTLGRPQERPAERYCVYGSAPGRELRRRNAPLAACGQSHSEREEDASERDAGADPCVPPVEASRAWLCAQAVDLVERLASVVKGVQLLEGVQLLAARNRRLQLLRRDLGRIRPEGRDEPVELGTGEPRPRISVGAVQRLAADRVGTVLRRCGASGSRWDRGRNDREGGHQPAGDVSRAGHCFLLRPRNRPVRFL
jgi:hypothetical protein